MTRVIAICMLGALFGCGSVSSDPDAPPGGGADGPPGGPDGPVARCDPSGQFQTPTHVVGINSSFDETGLSMTRDERIAFVGRVNTMGAQTLRMATRATAADDFGAATEDPLLAALNNAAGDEYGATSSADGLVLYFHRQTMTDIGIHVATRTGPMAPFGASSFVTVDGPALLSALTPHLSSDGQTLYWLDFSVFRLHSASRSGTPANFIGMADATQMDSVFNPVLSADELTLYYSDGFGTDILASTRNDTGARFGTGVPVANVSSPDMDWPVYLTADGCILYLASSRPGGLGGTDIWESRRAP
jgi:hypothetical protein